METANLAPVGDPPQVTHTRASIRHILCPTDFSDFSERALRRAAALAGWFRCPVTVLHVMPLSPPAPLMATPLGVGAPAMLVDFHYERREDVDEELRRIVASYAKTGVAIRTEVALGQPWREIETRARELDVDLVVMGTHGRGGWDRLIMGSTVEKLMRRLEVPVLTVGVSDVAPPPPLFRRILCALDLTPVSKETLDLAFSFAEENLAKVTLFHTVVGPWTGWLSGRAAAVREKELVHAREMAVEELHHLSREAPAFSEVDVVCAEGTAWREIVRAAREMEADLIVIGAHSGRALEDSFLGSTAAQTLRHAPCPVMVARPSSARLDADPVMAVRPLKPPRVPKSKRPKIHQEGDHSWLT